MTQALPPLKQVIAAHGLKPRKSLGQNFLLDLNLTGRIARAAGAGLGGTFYEVGPGPGGLTRALIDEGAVKVVVVERDPRCLPALEAIKTAYPGRLDIIAADALGVNERAILPSRTRVAANLPYNVGTALLLKWLTAEPWPPWWESLTLMFQREVAGRIVAKPGTKVYGRISVLVAWRSSAKILFDVNPGAFTPRPKVTSSVVQLLPLTRPVAPAVRSALEAVTGAAFGQRRKMLRQSLKPLGGEALLEAAGVSPTARPEELGVAQFAALARALKSLAGGSLPERIAGS